MPPEDAKTPEPKAPETIAEKLATLREQGLAEIEEHLTALKGLCSALGPIDRDRLVGILGRKKRSASTGTKKGGKKGSKTAKAETAKAAGA